MFHSYLNTISVPRIISTMAGQVAASPAAIVKDARDNCSVRVRNVSFGQDVLLAFDPATLQTTDPSGSTFRLPAGQSETFVLAEGQSLYVSTTSGPIDGFGAEISYHVFQQFPVDAR